MFTKCICTPSFLSCPGEFTEQKTDRRAASHICCALWNPVSLFFRRHLPHRSRVPDDSGRFFTRVSLFVVSFIISFPVDIPVFYSTGQVILKTVYHFYSILISFTYQVFSMLSAVFAPNFTIKERRAGALPALLGHAIAIRNHCPPSMGLSAYFTLYSRTSDLMPSFSA